jgi:hypothetical protein
MTLCHRRMHCPLKKHVAGKKRPRKLQMRVGTVMIRVSHARQTLVELTTAIKFSST